MSAEDTLILESAGPEATETLGAALGALLPSGSVVALRGDLAAGKTCLVRGMAGRFARDENVSSPTFTIVNQYGDAPALYHVDLYRLGSPEELMDLGIEDLFDPDGICVIEWAERAEGLLPSCRVDVLLEHAGENRRRITIENHGILLPGWHAGLF